VTDTATISDRRRSEARQGRLVLIVGPSGAGKDTLIGLAQGACADDRSIVFPRRVVTREASMHEDNTPISPAEFEQAVSRGDFALHWDAHGLRYGVPRSIVSDLDAGRAVVVNVSRTIIAAARRTFANIIVVMITAPAEVLAGRLAARSRSSDGKLDDRLRRSVDLLDSVPDTTISNTGRPEDHARELLRIIKGD
jgi:ribose 1,5-bisphosphokinase